MSVFVCTCTRVCLYVHVCLCLCACACLYVFGSIRFHHAQVHHHSRLRSSLCPFKSAATPLSHPSLSLSLVTSNLVFISAILSFQRCLVNGKLQCAASGAAICHCAWSPEHHPTCTHLLFPFPATYSSFKVLCDTCSDAPNCYRVSFAVLTCESLTRLYLVTRQALCLLCSGRGFSRHPCIHYLMEMSRSSH